MGLSMLEHVRTVITSGEWLQVYELMKEQLGLKRALDDLHPEPELKADAGGDKAPKEGAETGSSAGDEGQSGDADTHEDL